MWFNMAANLKKLSAEDQQVTISSSTELRLGNFCGPAHQSSGPSLSPSGLTQLLKTAIAQNKNGILILIKPYTQKLSREINMKL
jgi:hypothetical protein